jgi:hypothetical protein
VSSPFGSLFELDILNNSYLNAIKKDYYTNNHIGRVMILTDDQVVPDNSCYENKHKWGQHEFEEVGVG